MTGRRLPLVALFVGVVAVMVFVLAPRASSSPDGLERVAATTGIAAGERPHPLAGAPLAGYALDGVSNHSVGTGLAGAAGVVLTLGLATSLARVAVRRRRRTPA